MKLIVTGGSGLLALNLATTYRDEHDVLLLSHTKTVTLARTKSISVELEDEEMLEKIFNDWSPDVVIHAAGMTHVADCENLPDQAYYANVELVKRVSLVAKKCNTKLVYISSDHIFDGNSAFYSEEDKTFPLNTYAKSKLLGEEAARSVNTDCLIIRTNFFGWGSDIKPSFSDWIIGTLRRQEEITGYSNIFYTPIFIPYLANAILDLVGKDCSGVYNIVGSERVSKYEFILLVADKFELDNSLVKEGVYLANSGIKRPLDMSLDNSRIRKLLLTDFPSLSQSLEELSNQEKNGTKKEIQSCLL